MSNQRKPFGCPGCSKTVKVPLQHLGRRVKCPKCDFVFRAGPKQTEPEVIYAELDDDLPDFATEAPQIAPLAPSTLPASGLPPSVPSYQSPLAVVPSASKRKPEMDNSSSEKGQQFTGFVFVGFPLIATILPFFGFQFKLLVWLGDYAPLAAIIFGFIGVSLICAARRDESDRWIVGGVLASFVLATGIGGYLLIASFNDSHQKSNFTGDWNTGKPAMSFEEKVRESEARAEEHRKRMEELRKENKIRFEKQESERQARIEATRKRVEELRKQGKVFHGRIPSVEELMNGAELPEFPDNQ